MSFITNCPRFIVIAKYLFLLDEEHSAMTVNRPSVNCFECVPTIHFFGLRTIRLISASQHELTRGVCVI